GIMLRGFHSKSRSSTASSTAATGEAKVADMPAAAPATRSVFRSAAVSSKNWATRDPKAPPVMMIGPSAPNGPPLPIEMAPARAMGPTRQGAVKPPRAAAPRGSARARMPTPRPPRRRGRAHELAKRAHQRGPGRAQLGAMSERQAQQQPVPARGEPHQDPAAVARAARAAHQPVRLHAIDQLDGAVM